MPVAWLQAVVIFCAYCGYWGTFDLGTFASDGFGESEVYGASLATFRQWCRPVAAVFAGVLADRIGASRRVGYAKRASTWSRFTMKAELSRCQRWMVWGPMVVGADHG